MGGRVAMRAATLSEASRTERHHGAPAYLAAVVIEDMDLRVRQTAEELSLAPTDAAGREVLADPDPDPSSDPDPSRIPIPAGGARPAPRVRVTARARVRDTARARVRARV